MAGEVLAGKELYEALAGRTTKEGRKTGHWYTTLR